MSVVLGVVVSGLVLLDLSILLMAIRRADRTAEELAMHQLDETRRAAAEMETAAKMAMMVEVENFMLIGDCWRGLES